MKTKQRDKSAIAIFLAFLLGLAVGGFLWANSVSQTIIEVPVIQKVDCPKVECPEVKCPDIKCPEPTCDMNCCLNLYKNLKKLDDAF